MSDQHYEIHRLEGSDLPVICKRFHTVYPAGSYLNWHQNPELLLCLDGSGEVLSGGVRMAFRPGDLIAVNCNELHRVTTTERLEYVVLIVDTGFLSVNGIPVDQYEIACRIHDDNVRQLYTEAVQAYGSAAAFSAAEVRGCVLRLMAHLLRHYSKHRSAGQGDRNIGIKRAVAYILSNYAKPLTLDAIAAEAGLSRYHLSRTFKSVTGETVTEFINGVRCRYARQMLLQGEPVHRAAEACGFENRSYFARTFRRIIGCLPSEIEPQK